MAGPGRAGPSDVVPHFETSSFETSASEVMVVKAAGPGPTGRNRATFYSPDRKEHSHAARSTDLDVPRNTLQVKRLRLKLPSAEARHLSDSESHMNLPRHLLYFYQGRGSLQNNFVWSNLV